MIVRRTINKDEVKELPKTVFPGRIYVHQSETETEKAVAYLQSRSVIGIDSETRLPLQRDNHIKWHSFRFRRKNVVFCFAST